MSPHYPAPHPVIGILGGMGPAATIDLMRRVVEATPASDDADHVHLLVDQNPKVPSRVAALVTRTGPSPSDELVRMARGLEAQGATALAIACNTAHGYAADIAAAVRIPLLDMTALTAQAVAKRPLRHKRVGMLASNTEVALGLYRVAFDALGIGTVYPDRQDDVFRIVQSIKQNGVRPEYQEEFNEIARDLASGEVDVVIIACTELSLLTPDLPSDIPALDALDVLTTAIVDYGLGRTELK